MNKSKYLRLWTYGLFILCFFQIQFTKADDPFARIIASPTGAICTGDTILFSDNSFSTSTDLDTWEWTFSGGTPSVATGQGPHEIVWNSAGDFEIQLIVSTNGISDTTTYEVSVVEAPISNDFTETIDLSNGPVNVQLTPDNFNSSFSYTWIINDLVEGEVVYNEANVSHLIQVNGNHTGQLVVSNGSCSSSYDVLITSAGGEGDLVANFTISDTVSCVDSYLTFEHENTEGVTSWEWDFGEGAHPRFAYNGGPINVFYSSPGVKSVLLVVGNGGLSESVEREVVIGGSENGISIAANPKLSTDGDTIFVQPSSVISFRPNGESGLANSYLWDFGDPFAQEADSTSESRIGDHSFDTGGLYAVKLTRESSEGCVSEFVQYVRVVTESDQSGDFAISPSGKTCVFNSVSFTSKARGFAQGAAEVVWYFGAEGDAFPQSSDGFIPDSVYWTQPGKKIIKVVSKSSQDYEDSVVHSLIYDVLAYPEATFSFNDTAICSSNAQEVSFLPSMQLEYGIYNWSVVDESGGEQSSSSVEPKFTLLPDEKYTVSLEVSNSYCTSSYSRIIQTGSGCDDIWAGLIVQPARDNCGLLRYIIEGVGSESIQSWDFNFGGGTAEPEADGTSSGPFTVDFPPSQSGSQITLTVDDGSGNEETVTVTLDGSNQVRIP
ncbi:PKD domain-containing protein [Sediminitomix flava]|uniref:PKD domain-containing protein n=1 Tax=Sediminitomix flava TaxID=379075 RepID=A0A315ZB67_SEDFL|nr:PKD domain-containing protein [Sediminitomix flava]PWJ42058.1 hypothetical protein BC781_103308 [Sediminitomix flava]